MKPIPGVDHEQLERLYMLASAKAQIVAAEQLLREAVSNMKIADVNDQTCVDAVQAVVTLRERIFQIFEEGL